MSSRQQAVALLGVGRQNPFAQLAGLLGGHTWEPPRGGDLRKVRVLPHEKEADKLALVGQDKCSSEGEPQFCGNFIFKDWIILFFFNVVFIVIINLFIGHPMA